METSTPPTRAEVQKRFPHLKPMPEVPHLAQLSGDKVLMFADSPFTLTLHQGETIDYFKGMNAVAVELKNHPYIVANMRPASEVGSEAGAATQVNPLREEAISWLMSEQVADGETPDREAATKIVDEEGTKTILAHKNYTINKKAEEMKSNRGNQQKKPIATGLGFDK